MRQTINIEDLTSDFKEEITEKDNPLAILLAKAQINTKDKIERVPAVMAIIEGLNTIDVMTEGNISIIKGRAKSRKSFAVAMLIGSYLSSLPLFRTFHAKTKNICLLFDTEQSSFYVQQSMFRIQALADEQSYSTRFFAFCLRPYSPDKRLQIIEYCIYNLAKNMKLGLIVIDGIRDLIRDINSPDEATMISSKLLKWTEETGCHILNVLHENPSDGKLRGHIGTELMNKAETVFRIEKNEIQTNISKLSADMTRGLDFEDIYFTVEDNVPQVVDKNLIQSSNERF